MRVVKDTLRGLAVLLGLCGLVFAYIAGAARVGYWLGGNEGAVISAVVAVMAPVFLTISHEIGRKR